MSCEDRLYLASANVIRLEKVLEKAKAELSIATQLYAEKHNTDWECGDCGKPLSHGEIVRVEPHCNECGKSNFHRKAARR